MAVASAVIATLRSQLNDNISPYRHSDFDILRWLDDGQKLIAQLKPEAYTQSVTIQPELGTCRQRADENTAFNLVRVDQNLLYENSPISDPGFVPAPIRNHPPVSYPEFTMLTIYNGSPSSLPVSTTYTPPTGWEALPDPAIIISWALDDGAGPTTVTGVTHGGRPMSIFKAVRQYTDDSPVQVNVELGIAILQLDPADPPPNNTVQITGVNGSGAINYIYVNGSTWKSVDVATTVANFPSNASPLHTSLDGYSMSMGPLTVSGGDMILLCQWVDWNDTIQMSSWGFEYPENWYDIKFPGDYGAGYSFMVASDYGAVASTYGGEAAAPMGMVLMHMINDGETSWSETVHFGFTSGQFSPGDEATLLGDYADALQASTVAAYAWPVRIYAATADMIDVITETPGAMIQAVDRDVYDTFDPDWLSRAPSPEPTPGTKYFDGWCYDPDDPLGFFLHPMPNFPTTGYDFSKHQVLATVVGVPPQLANANDTLALSDMYTEPLVSYAMFRALSAQTQGYSAAGASRAIERFGEQLNLSRETIQGLMDPAHREREQTQ